MSQTGVLALESGPQRLLPKQTKAEILAEELEGFHTNRTSGSLSFRPESPFELQPFHFKHAGKR